MEYWWAQPLSHDERMRPRSVPGTIDNKYTGWETFVIPEGTMRVVLQTLPVHV